MKYWLEAARPLADDYASLGAWTVFQAAEARDAFWAAWDQLNLRLRRGHPFTDSRFVRPLLEHFGTGRERISACETGGSLSAAAVLVPHAAGEWRTFLPDQTQMAPALVADLRAAAEMVTNLPGVGLAIDFLCQDPLHSPFGSQGHEPHLAVTPYADTMSVDLSDGFEVYWERRSRNLKKNVSRYTRRREQSGLSLKLTRLTEPGEMRPAVVRYGEVETRGWKGRQGTALHQSNVQGQFYAELMERFAAEDRAEVFELHIGGRLAASRLLVRNEDFRIILKTTYDEALAEYAPGRVLLYEMLKTLADSPGPKRVEFYTKATTDQLAWASAQRGIFHATLFRWGAVKRGAQVVKWIRRGLSEPDAPGSDEPATGT